MKTSLRVSKSIQPEAIESFSRGFGPQFAAVCKCYRVYIEKKFESFDCFCNAFFMVISLHMLKSVN